MESEAILQETRPNENVVHYQDKRALLLYLTLRFPSKYFLYKSSMYVDFCEVTGFRNKPKRKSKSDYSDVNNFIQMSEDVCGILKEDKELMEIHEAIIPEQYRVEDNDHTITQDFIYAVATYLKPDNALKYSIEEMRKLFTEYLNRVIPKSARNYLSGISKVTEVLVDEHCVKQSIYELQTVTSFNVALEKIKDNIEWIERNSVGNNMFSAAFKHYGKFLQELNNSSSIAKDEKWYVLARAMQKIGDEKALNLVFDYMAELLDTHNVENDDIRTYAGIVKKGNIIHLTFGVHYVAMIKTQGNRIEFGFYDSIDNKESLLKQYGDKIRIVPRSESTNSMWCELESSDVDIDEIKTSAIRSVSHLLNLERSGYRNTYPKNHNPWIYKAARNSEIRKMLWQEDFSEENLIDKSMENQPTSLNQILFGPPGTGKTFNSINHAVSIVEGVSIDDLIKEERGAVTQRYQEYVNAGQIVFTTFHQSMSYEDFVEGIKPDVRNGQVVYDLKNGIFKQIANEANSNFDKNLSPTQDFDDVFDLLLKEWEESENGELNIAMKSKTKEFVITRISNRNIEFRKPSGGTGHDLVIATLKALYLEDRVMDSGLAVYYYPLIDKLRSYDLDRGIVEKKNYILIIDEINRGNVSSIFGELITLLEEDKRKGNKEALEITLPYSKEKFSVPSNLHVIGTMNTADRSVEALDTALRRRFSFIEMPPKPELIDEVGINDTDIDLTHLLKVINKRIEKLIDKDHMIGHSYFLSIESLDDLKMSFQNKIMPLLQEYFFGDYGKMGLVIGEGFFVKREEDKGDVFAKFQDYEVDSLLERPIYHLKNVIEMSDDTFEEALNTLLGNSK